MAIAGTSGTIGTATFNNAKVIEHAFRSCRKAPQEIGGEDVDTALDQLQMMLLAWSANNTPLWCQTQYLLPLTLGVYTLDTSLYLGGIVDIFEAELRQTQAFSGTLSITPTAATLQLNSPDYCEDVGILPGASATWNIELQYSNDGVNWTTAYANPALVVTAGIMTWLGPFQGLPTAAYWQIAAVQTQQIGWTADASAPTMDSTSPTVDSSGTGGTNTISVTNIVFGKAAQEIPITRINKDDYWTLPNKSFQGRPLQYWCDRQASGPVLWLWPAPAQQFANFYCIDVLAKRHIMDVGAMADTLEIPIRGFEAVYLSLAERLRRVIPGVDKKETADVPAAALAARKDFWGEEVDDSPVFLSLDITAYTR